MGNKGSKGITKDGEITKLDPAKFKLPNVLDHIATKYILTQNFKDLTNLDKEEYCNKLIIMTSNIIKKYFNEKEIQYLEQRTKGGIPIEKMAKDKVIFKQNGVQLSNFNLNSSTNKFSASVILQPGNNVFEIVGSNAYGSDQDSKIIIYQKSELYITRGKVPRKETLTTFLFSIMR